MSAEVKRNNCFDLHGAAKKLIGGALSRCIQTAYQLDVPPTQLQFAHSKKRGDLSVQFFRFSKQFKSKPPQTSQKIAEEFERVLKDVDSEVARVVDRISVDGPYINFFYSMPFLGRIVTASEDPDNSFFDKRDNSPDLDRVMIEYSQPNTHKAFHVGHMRNAALGDSLIRLYEQLGHEVVAANYFGDEGAHVAKCLWLLQKCVSTAELESVPKSDIGEFLGAVYTKSVELLDLSTWTRYPVPGIVAAKVESISPHPKRSDWKVVEVDAGELGGHQVVCAGTGYGEGDVVAYTPVGGKLKGNDVIVKDMEGVQSAGVIMGVNELAGVPPSQPSSSPSSSSPLASSSQQKSLEDFETVEEWEKHEMAKLEKQQKAMWDKFRIEQSQQSNAPTEEKKESTPSSSSSKKSEKKKKKKDKGKKKVTEKRIYILPPGTPHGAKLTELGRISGEQPPSSEEKEVALDEKLLKQYATKFNEGPVITLDDSVSVVAHVEALKAEVRDVLKRLEEKESEIISLWKKTRQYSLDEFKRIYDWLNCRFDKDFFESDVGESSKQMALDYLEKGVLIKSDGCVGADLSKFGLGFSMLLKSDGSGLYATKDLVLALKKFDEFKIDKSIYVVDTSQSFHFQQVFKTLELMGYPQAQKCVHLAYNFVTLPQGKMSSRAGNVIVFSQLVEQLQEHLKKNYTAEWDPKELEHALHAVSVGTIKYGMLNQDISREIVFDLEEWSNPVGNTGSFLMYQYTRIASIIREVPEPEGGEVDFSLLTHELDRQILSEISRFWDIVAQCASSGNPMPLCQYLYHLCKTFSSWYSDRSNSVKHAETDSLKKTRMAEIRCLLKCLKTGLGLLGITVLEKM